MDVESFRETFDGDVIVPGDDGYEAARAVWNAIIDRRPALVARPGRAEAVAAAIRFARDNDLEIAVRSGGHSIPGFSTCDGGMIVDLSRMRGVTVDPETRRARVNGGALLAELDDAAQAAELVCPVGVVSHTGVAGLTLGGGMGWLHRKFGLTIDHLEAVDLVTAEGERVHASNDENVELFWGIRGAGANFGIVTAFEFRLQEFGPRLTRGSIIHPIERGGELLGLFRDYAATASRDVLITVGTGWATPHDQYPDDIAGRPIISVGLTHCGAPEVAERDLAPIRTFGPPIVGTMESSKYLELQHTYDEPFAWGRRFYMKSRFMTELSDAAIDVLLAEGSTSPEQSGFSVWMWGGEIANVPEEATAFSGRSAAYWGGVESLWEDPALDEEMIGWARRSMDAFSKHTMTTGYVNDQPDAGAEGVRSIYGPEKWERLVGLKRTWDPDNIFHRNQNIVP